MSHPAGSEKYKQLPQNWDKDAEPMSDEQQQHLEEVISEAEKKPSTATKKTHSNKKKADNTNK